MTNIFDGSTEPTREQADQVKFEDLVGEGKKYADADALAKALAHSNLHIHNLTKEKEEVLQDLSTRQSVAEALKALEAKNGRVEGTPPDNNTNQQQKVEGAGLTLEDIEKLMEQRETASKEQKNFDYVQSKIKEFTGSDDAARTYVQSKLKDVGMSGQDMQDLAKKSPDIVLKLLEVGVKSTDGTSGIRSIRLPTDSGPKGADERLLEELKALRSTDPKRYHSPKVRQQIYDLEFKIRKSKA